MNVEKRDYIIYIQKNNEPLKYKKETYHSIPEARSIPWYLFFRKKKILEDQENKLKYVNYYNKKIDQKNKERNEDFEKQVKLFKSARDHFFKEIENESSLYANKDREAVEQYYDIVLDKADYPIVLDKADYPINLDKDWDIFYDNEKQLLIIDYLIPLKDTMPSIETIKYVKSTDSFVEKHISQTKQKSLYDDFIYQSVLRIMHIIFSADKVDAVLTLSINGVVRDISPKTGSEEQKCILSLQITKEEFQNIKLSAISDVRKFKECFKALKGISAAAITDLVPIAPIQKSYKEDKRFREHHDISLTEEQNIASMDWKEFENLITELFLKEFNEKGLEVKMTQSSYDGGVDAMILDPDPITGGKIIIQAKRYTNTINVSAVRDLYGTTMNEGAKLGILITTSDFGKESYRFIEGKPINLINGNHLLHMLQKHGYKCKIDIAEAKKKILK